MWSFDGTTIVIVGPGTTRDRTALLSVRVMPQVAGTDQHIWVDRVATPTAHCTLPLFFALQADFATLLAKVGVQGVLISPDTPSPGKQALLTELQRTDRGLSTNGETSATASFTLAE